MNVLRTWTAQAAKSSDLRFLLLTSAIVYSRRESELGTRLNILLADLAILTINHFRIASVKPVVECLDASPIPMRFFTGLSLEKSARRRLAAIAGLTPGQVKAVWQKHRFIPVAQLQPDTIIAALENEARYEGGQAGNIGFGS